MHTWDVQIASMMTPSCISTLTRIMKNYRLVLDDDDDDKDALPPYY